MRKAGNEHDYGVFMDLAPLKCSPFIAALTFHLHGQLTWHVPLKAKLGVSPQLSLGSPEPCRP